MLQRPGQPVLAGCRGRGGAGSDLADHVRLGARARVASGLAGGLGAEDPVVKPAVPVFLPRILAGTAAQAQDLGVLPRCTAME